MFKDVRVPRVPSEETFKRPSEFRSPELKTSCLFWLIFLCFLSYRKATHCRNSHSTICEAVLSV